MPVIGAAGFRSNRLPIWRLVALAVLVVVLGVRPGAAGELALDLDGDNEAVVAECAEAGDVELPAVLDDLDTESAEPELLAVLAALDDADDTNEAAELCARLLAALGLGDDQQADDDPSSSDGEDVASEADAAEEEEPRGQAPEIPEPPEDEPVAEEPERAAIPDLPEDSEQPEPQAENPEADEDEGTWRSAGAEPAPVEHPPEPEPLVVDEAVQPERQAAGPALRSREAEVDAVEIAMADELDLAVSAPEVAAPEAAPQVASPAVAAEPLPRPAGPPGTLELTSSTRAPGDGMPVAYLVALLLGYGLLRRRGRRPPPLADPRVKDLFPRT